MRLLKLSCDGKVGYINPHKIVAVAVVEGAVSILMDNGEDFTCDETIEEIETRLEGIR